MHSVAVQGNGAMLTVNNETTPHCVTAPPKVEHAWPFTQSFLSAPPPARDAQGASFRPKLVSYLGRLMA